MLIPRIHGLAKKDKTDCNSIPEALRPFHLPMETIEQLTRKAYRIGIPMEALVSSILQEAV